MNNNSIDALTMGSVVRRSAALYPERTALIFNDERCTFKQYNERVNKAAHALHHLGMTKGDHVAILGKNSIQYLEMCHGSAKVGVVFGTINWRLTADEIAYIISDADNKILFVEYEFQDLISQFRDKINSVEIVVYGGKCTLENAYQYEDIIVQMNTSEPDIIINGDDDAIIMYTSGTTGLPKGAVLRHRNIVWDSIFSLTYVPPHQHDCFLLSMPMNHVSGLHTQTTTFLSRGLPMVIMSQWEPYEACRLIEKHRVTLAYILVTPLLQLLDSPAKTQYDLTSLRRVMSAAARYTPEMVARVLSELEVDSMYFAYGLTEAAPIVSGTEFTAEMIVKPNTMGKPVWYNDVRIVDDNGNEMPRGEVGEITVMGPNVFKGYYKRPEANAETLKNGWLHTGDLGYVDNEGFLFFVDRKKDMIKSGGENVFSLEVENAISKANEEIAEVAVIGIPDATWGEMVTACVVLKAGKKTTSEKIIENTRKILAGYKTPKRVEICDALPKNISGKVLKRNLKESLQ